IRSPRRRRTLGLFVVGGQVEVRAPMRTSPQRIREFVHAKRQWVRDKLREHRERAKVPPLGYGDIVPYLGRKVPLLVVPEPGGAFHVALHNAECETLDAGRLDWHHLHATVPMAADEAATRAGVRGALVAWYRARALEEFTEQVELWLPDVAPRKKPEIRISNARSQWASCSADGVLRFSWRCMMLDRRQVAYVTVHELAHLKVRNHSKAFWRVVLKAMDDAKIVRAGMRERAKTLPG
ncbi:MAG: SprT family zinc-dependent metalloprotease, partial [Chloroflexota bacterium]|nr:SprT family zinc-dependent metalloprotease [Chloroflexota bacterium]